MYMKNHECGKIHTLNYSAKIQFQYHFKSNYLFRNSFIILQFTIAILALCISVILNHQIKFMKNADLGFERNNILVGSIDLDYKNLDAAKPKFNQN